jgi:signal transduction histidine kinase
VPAIADWWAVDLLEETGSLRRVVSYGPPDHPGVAEQLKGLYPPAGELGAISDPFRVVRTSRVEMMLTGLDPIRLALSTNPQHLEVLRQIGPISSVCVPLTFRGQTLGAMTFARTSEVFRTLQLAFARTLGHRVGQAVAQGRMYQELQNASRRKDEYLAMLGHELRNPLGALSNSLAVLQSGHLPRESEAHVHAIISHQLQQLTKLVGDLLDVARFTSGKIVLQLVPVDLLALAERSLETIRGTAKNGGHDIRLEGTPVVVHGDSVRLEQVLDNLIDNAVKYTPRGGQIAVSIGASGGEAVLRVRDTGVGVPAELLPHMFELFTQGRQGIERQHGGLGIGLAIVKRIIDLHGGTVHADSPGPGAGTEVIVRLPLATAAAPEAAREAPRPAAVRRQRILVVEDNADARETLRLLLELGGHEVELAGDGQTGLEIALRSHPQVALIDLGLPGLDGYDLARSLRAKPESAAIRLVALTGYGQPHDRRRAAEVGFDAYLVKPVDRDTLYRAIQAV